MTDTAQNNYSGGAWLLADLSLNIWALSIVKALGLGYPASQLVFLRACIGLLVITPILWRKRALFAHLSQPYLHILRVLLSAVALTCSYYAISRVPFALFTTIGFTRPLVMMALAALILHETVPARRWIAASIAFVGILVAVEVDNLQAGGWGLAAVFGAVLLGTSAVVVTRKLHTAPVVVMMGIYGVGLLLVSAPFAVMNWQPIPDGQLLPLLMIGAFSQCAQFCFLTAHKKAEAGFLAILGYLSLILSTTVGYFLFDEVPTLRFFFGAAMIVAATAWVSLSGASRRRFAVR